MGKKVICPVARDTKGRRKVAKYRGCLCAEPHDHTLECEGDHHPHDWCKPCVPVEQEKGQGELLPCPFCGGKAEMNIGGFGERFVTCADDRCGGRMGGGIWFPNEVDAAAHWNSVLMKKGVQSDR